MSGVNSIATSALSAFSVKQSVTANNLANLQSTGFKASSVVLQDNLAGGVNPIVSRGTDSVEISREATDMLVTKGNYTANIKVLQASDEMAKTAMNIKA